MKNLNSLLLNVLPDLNFALQNEKDIRSEMQQNQSRLEFLTEVSSILLHRSIIQKHWQIW